MPNIDRTLVICEQREDRENLAPCVLKGGFAPSYCSNIEEARALLSQEKFRFVLCSDKLYDGDFRMILKEIEKSGEYTPLIVLSHSNDWDSYLTALGFGAFDLILCPPHPAEAERILRSALAATVESVQSAHAA